MMMDLKMGASYPVLKMQGLVESEGKQTWPAAEKMEQSKLTAAVTAAAVGEAVVATASKFRTVCVFCGSNAGKRSCYRDAAVELGRELVARKMDLVYGGGSLGLMGLVSETVFSGGGNVLGIIPPMLMHKELTGEMAVAVMHQKKAEMARHSDVFIALPGGYGTLQELLEVVSWAQLGIHKKPVGLLNVDGYYNSLLAFIDEAVAAGFIKPFQRNIIVSSPNAKDLVQKLEEFVPVQDAIVAKLRWETEQVGYNNSLHPGIDR